MTRVARRVASAALVFSMAAITLGAPTAQVRASDEGADERPPAPTAPASLNLYRAGGFRYQDPNYVACTATSAMDMLNFIALANTGGDGFKWQVNLSGSMRDAVLRYEKSHDTIVTTANGSDPHGWRNALNHYGWGDQALGDGARVYEDRGFDTMNEAIRAAVRQMITTRKPVGVLGWSGRHAQMITGYYGLTGDPFAKTAEGGWLNRFTVAGVYLTDPLRADGLVNAKISLTQLSSGRNTIRFARYMETDSPYDDPYQAGERASRGEWVNHFVLVLPVK